MLKHLDSILAAVALTTGSLAAVGCDSGDGDTDDTSGETTGTSAGCPGTSAGCPGTSAGCPGAVDEDMILQEVMAFDAGSYTKVNLNPENPTQHAATEVDIWVPNDLTGDYYSIDPADYASANVSFAEGTILIKKHFTDGAGDGWTVMYKAGEGYNADAGDWWWGRVDEGGTYLVSGVVDTCIGCHSVAGDPADWVRGIAAENHAG